ncbi:hypothetical protein W5O_03198 [Candida albicans Ca6]|nr:hypothetical protein W5O_03198 [Candida albicans Ca6]
MNTDLVTILFWTYIWSLFINVCISDEIVIDSSKYGRLTITNNTSQDTLEVANTLPNSQPKMFMHKTETYSVEVINATTLSENTRKKRFDVSGPVPTPAQANVCVLGAAFSYQVMKDITNGIKYLLKTDQCQIDLAMIKVTRDVDVYKQASKITGSCDLIRKSEIIELVLQEQIDEVYNTRICAFQCIKLRRGLDWTFYLKFGTSRDLVQYTECSSKTGGFSECREGEINDI